MPPSERTPQTHLLKTWTQYLEAVWDGRKKHEVRVDDRDFEVGDTLILREYDPSAKVFGERAVVARVTYVTRAPFVPAGLCVMSIEVVKKVSDYLTWEGAPPISGAV